MWFNSTLYKNILEQNDSSKIIDCFTENSPLIPYLNDFISLEVTIDNYQYLIQLCDFLMIEENDIMIDIIVSKFGQDIIHTFATT